MALSKAAMDFVDQAADTIISVDDLVNEKRDEFSALYLELLQSPERRDDQIEVQMIGYLYEQSLDELDGEFAVEYWQTIAEAMDMTWDQLNDIPLNERGDVFHTTRKIMSAVAWKQAFIEAGIAVEVVRLGLDFGEVVKTIAQRVDVKTLVGGSGIKSAMKKKLADRETNPNG